MTSCDINNLLPRTEMLLSLWATPTAPSGQYGRCASFFVYFNMRMAAKTGVLRCEKMLKCVHDYFVYLK